MAAPRPRPTAPAPVPSADIAVVVDESGSIDADTLSQEKDAASLIAAGELAPDSTVSVIGFGSAPPGGSAIDPVCPTRDVSTPENRQALETCIGQLHARTDAQGNDTDFVAALNTAIADLAEAGARPGHLGRPRLLYVLTDGRLDVSEDPAFGSDPASRDAAATTQLDTQTLPAARSAGVDIWPLGFGDADTAELGHFAAGGAQNTLCQPTGIRPRAAFVQHRQPGDIARAFFGVYAATRCFKVAEGPAATSINPGQTREVTVTVPAGAGEANVLAVRGDPQLRVTVATPSGQVAPPTGTLGDAAFKLGGADGQVAGLLVSNPPSGTWTLRVQAPASLPRPALFSASVLWKPATPAPGASAPASASAKLTGRHHSGLVGFASGPLWPVIAALALVLALIAAMVMWRRRRRRHPAEQSLLINDVRLELWHQGGQQAAPLFPPTRPVLTFPFVVRDTPYGPRLDEPRANEAAQAFQLSRRPDRMVQLRRPGGGPPQDLPPGARVEIRPGVEISYAAPASKAASFAGARFSRR